MARVLHLISSNERRGAEVFASELAEHLRSVGHEVRVMAVVPSASTELLDAEVAGTHRTDPLGLVRALKAARWADVVVSFGSISLLTGALVAKLAHRPFVYRNIGDPSVWGKARFAGLRIGAPLRTAATIVALYPDAAETLASRYRLDRERIRIIPRGVPEGRFEVATEADRTAARERLGLDGSRRWLAYVGALSSEKDPLLAIGSLAPLPDDVGLVVAGGGPMAEVVAEAAAPYGDRAVLLGSVNDVRSVLAAADLLVLPSRTEGIPGAVIEAGLSGRAAVATAVGGVPHVVDDRVSGRLVALDRPDEFSDAIVDALDHADEYGRAAARKCSDEYSMRNVGGRWETVIADLVRDRTRRSPGDTATRPATTATSATSTVAGGTILHVVASTQRRGAEMFAAQLATALSERSWPGEVVAVEDSPGHDELDLRVMGRGRFRPSTIRALVDLARRHDVVIAHGSNSLLPAGLSACLAHRPFVYRNIGDPSHWGNVPLAGLRIGFPLKRAAVVVTLSDRARSWIIERYGLPRGRVVVIPNAVDADAFTPATAEERSAARAALGLPDDALVYGYLGSLSPEKRPEWAVRTAGALPDATLLLGGSGPERHALERLAADVAPGRVHFLGSVADPPAFLAAIDLLLLPSVTEGMPAVAIEAGLCGRRVVATDVGVVDQIVRTPDAGTLVPRDSLDGFVAAVADAGHGGEVLPETRERLRADYGMDSSVERWIADLTRIVRRV